MKLFGRTEVRVVRIDLLCAERLLYAIAGRRPVDHADVITLRNAVLSAGGGASDLEEVAVFASEYHHGG